MSSLASRVSQLLPEGNFKNNLRLLGFKLLFSTVGTKEVTIGTTREQVPACIARLVFTRESLGTRENEGYLLHYRPKPGDIVINAGSYHGYFAIYASRLVGSSGRVICFEPEPNNFRLLLKNISLNSLTNVTTLPYGLWSSNTALPFISMGSGSQFNPASAWHKQTIPVRTLDSALSELKLPRLNLLTMDIEGAELEALAGARSSIASHPEINIAIASYHRVQDSPTSSRVEQVLHQYGLFAKTEYPRHLTTYGWHRHA